MPIKIAAPLYILRRQCGEDLMAVLGRLRELGFDGVEFLGADFFGHSPQAVRARLDELGLMALGNHVEYSRFEEDLPAVLAAHRAVGCRYLTVGSIPPQCLPGGDEWLRGRQALTAWGGVFRAAGMALLFHNHAAELWARAGERTVLEALLDGVPADALCAEPDLGWMAIAGADPGAFLVKYRDRCPVLHFKDYYADGPLPVNRAMPSDRRGGAEEGCFEFRPTGYGVMNYPALLPLALACDPAWIVVDHDAAYERDPYVDLALSLGYTRALLGLA